ncbi:MAG: hypothetical protein M3198_11035 [Actinomycetota bacterium]|nr:hypothetical protein [Actinomycetota bacterium]
MSREVRVADVVLAATVLLFVSGLALMVASGEMAWPLAVFFGVEIAFPAVGWFIVRVTRNRVGWVFLAAGLGLAMQAFSSGYGEYGLVERPGALPGAVVVTWLGEVVWLPQLVVATMFLFLLFPEGRLPSRRWRSVAYLGVAGVLLLEASILFAPTLYAHEDVRAPLAGVLSESVLAVLGTVGGLILLPTVLLALSAVVVRYRRAGTVGRAQIKWFAYAATVFLAAELTFNVFELGRDNALLSVLNGLAGLLIPAAVAIAILRHRLYDIDVVINRTLVYAGLTAFLAAVYAVGVLVLGQLLSATAGGNDIAVAASTLAVAGLFRPARARIQEWVDRHFYRRRYDAARTLEAFAARLRQQVDLTAVVRDLEATVSETLQPQSVFTWLTPSDALPARHSTDRRG